MDYGWLLYLSLALLFGVIVSAFLPALDAVKNDMPEPAYPPKNILIVGWDGVQRDHFRHCLGRELPECRDGLPRLQGVKGMRIFDSTVTDGYTKTKPGWSQILTGYSSNTTGIISNTVYRPLPQGYTLLEKIEKHYGDENVYTLMVSGKSQHAGAACIGEKTTGQKTENRGEPYCNTRENLDDPIFFLEGGIPNMLNRDVGRTAISRLRSHLAENSSQMMAAFILFSYPDTIGHYKGENSLQYTRHLKDCDEWLGKILYVLNESGVIEDTLIYVITDHGFDENGTNHGNAPYGFLATNDPAFKREGDRLDFTPTLLEKHGIPLHGGNETPPLDGRPLSVPDPRDCIPEGQAYIDYPQAPECCINLTLISLDVYTQWGRCVPATGGEGDKSGFCTKCGDGDCLDPETRCNCPADCGETKKNLHELSTGY